MERGNEELAPSPVRGRGPYSLSCTRERAGVRVFGLRESRVFRTPPKTLTLTLSRVQERGPEDVIGNF